MEWVEPHRFSQRGDLMQRLRQSGERANPPQSSINEGSQQGIAADAWPAATCEDPPGRPAGNPGRKRSSAGDVPGGVEVGREAGCKPVVGEGKGRAEKLAGNDDNGANASGRFRNRR